MFNATLKEGAMLKKIVDSIKDIVSDINLDISMLGISLQAMDTSHVSLVVLVLNQEGFESFDCKEKISIGLSMQDLHKVLKCATNDDKIKLSLDESPSHLTIKFDNPNLKKKSEFNVALKNCKVDHLGIPNNQYDSIIIMNSNEFTRICRELYFLNETVVIETTQGMIKFNVVDNLIAGSIILEENDNFTDDSIKIIVYEPVFLAFSLKYLNMFAKASMLSNQIMLSLSVTFPLMLEFKIAKLGRLSFHLAPRIEDNK